jgi:hypothetical protein
MQLSDVADEKQGKSMTNIERALMIASAVASVALPSPAAAQERLDNPPKYQVSYEPNTNRYCVRLYKHGETGATKSIGNGLNCRSKSSWERAGLKIAHPSLGALQVAQR